MEAPRWECCRRDNRGAEGWGSCVGRECPPPYWEESGEGVVPPPIKFFHF